MEKLLDCLKYIDPDDYDVWLKVGMGLKHENYSCSDWDAWSMGSQKYKPGVCEKKWNSFNRHDITGGTIFQMAMENGYRPESSIKTFGWDDEVDTIGLDYKIIDPTYVKEKTLPEMSGKPIDDLREYLNLLFQDDEYVGYCDKLEEIDGRWVPRNGYKGRTKKQLIEDLKHGFSKSTISERYPKETPAGAMIRFNPLDGQGESDANVTDFRYCLVESDKDSIEKQYALYQEMKLPIVCLVHSGNKSLHAIIHVDAGQDHRTYQNRVNFIYEFCKKNGLHVDPNDRNASRYSRMPGIMRGEKYQYIVARNIGFASYDEWKEWADTQNDNLPEDVTLAEVFQDLPPLKEELIEGVLRVGHKMLISAPSKAGKTFLLMELAICFAEGIRWMGYQCKQGKVLYINLELDGNSCFNRFHDIYTRMGLAPKNANMITVWNLRGRAVPMDKLTPFLISRYKNKGYVAIIIDPIYKVITGDENNATEMSEFCSYFDRVSLETQTAMIYCHHHSKGATGRYKNAVDRSSGSGVFARDPDAILDLTQLVVEEGAEKRYRENVNTETKSLTAWELSGTLREFPPLIASRLWFDYPIHNIDIGNFLADARYGEAKGKQGVSEGQKEKTEIADELEELFDIETFETNEAIQKERVMEELGLSESNLRKHTSAKTNFATATLQNGTKVVYRRGNKVITYKGTSYTHISDNNKVPWTPI